MKKTVLVNCLLAVGVLTSSFALADQQQEIADLKQRLNALEEQEPKDDRLSWVDKVDIGGVLEIEASYEDSDSDSSTSDLVVATAELSLEAAVTGEVSALLVFLYEEDEGDLDVDIASATYTPEGTDFSFSVGQGYLPFGAYETALVNDPLSLDIGEVRETAFIATYEAGLFNGAVYLFNGDQNEDGKDRINHYGVHLGLGNNTFALGFDYLSNLADTDGLQENDYGYDAGEDVVSGISVYGSVSFGSIHLVGEHLTALDSFAVDGNNSELSASQLEASLEVGRFSYAISYQETGEAAFAGLPEERLSIGVSTEVFGGINLGIQLQQDEDYSISNDGTGDTTIGAVIQLAAEF